MMIPGSRKLPESTAMNELRCILYPGQFGDEFTVVVESFNGRRFSLFVPREDVRLEGRARRECTTPGWLKVKVVRSQAGNALVLLPQSTLENGRYLAVRLDQLGSLCDAVAV